MYATDFIYSVYSSLCRCYLRTGMADVTTLMIYFGTAERVSILLSLFLIPEPTIRRITTLLLRYVLPVAGPDVAHKAWVKVVSGLQHRLHRGALTRQLDYVYSEGDVIDLLVSKIFSGYEKALYFYIII